MSDTLTLCICGKISTHGCNYSRCYDGNHDPRCCRPEAFSVSDNTPTREMKMLKVAGKPFVCECGCNVFWEEDGVYYCNACPNRYEVPDE